MVTSQQRYTEEAFSEASVILSSWSIVLESNYRGVSRELSMEQRRVRSQENLKASLFHDLESEGGGYKTRSWLFKAHGLQGVHRPIFSPFLPGTPNKIDTGRVLKLVLTHRCSFLWGCLLSRSRPLE